MEPVVGFEPTTDGLQNRCSPASVRQLLTTMDSGTLSSALSVWQRLAAAGKRPATQKYHAELVHIFITHFPNPDSLVSHIEASHVAEFVERVGHYSAPRYNALLGLLKSVVPHAPPLRRRPVTPKEVELPNQTQFTALLAELDKAHRGFGGLACRFLALTGLRIKEARLIRWSDVPPDCIIVPSSVTKNGRPRAVPMVAGLCEVVNRLRGVGKERATVLPYASLRTALRKACERAGVRRLTHHDMRRLFATRCIQSGVDVPTLARWLGHRDGGALLAKTYFHLADSHSREMALRVKIAA